MSRPAPDPHRSTPGKPSLGRIRNFGIIAHVDAGKTTATEHLLHYAKVIHRVGGVDEGTAATDDYPLEQRKGITIFSAAVTCQWRGCHLNLIDTPSARRQRSTTAQRPQRRPPSSTRS